MPRPERNGTCSICRGKVRHYPSLTEGPGQWAHLDRSDWIDNPHDPAPTTESVAAAGLSPSG